MKTNQFLLLVFLCVAPLTHAQTFNSRVATYNKTNQNLNSDKQRIFNDYENTKQSFLSRHIPND